MLKETFSKSNILRDKIELPEGTLYLQVILKDKLPRESIIQSLELNIGKVIIEYKLLKKYVTEN